MTQLYFVVISHNKKIIAPIPSSWMMCDNPKLNQNCEWHWPKQNAATKSQNNECVKKDWTIQYGTILSITSKHFKIIL